MLQLDNRTALAASIFSSPDPDGIDTLYTIVKGTFDLRSGLPAEEQIPVLLQDEHHGDPATSSVRLPADIGLAKPSTDVLLIGSAHAPHDLPTTWMDVTLRVGSVSKTVHVVGDRSWERGPTGRIQAGPPSGFTVMPLKWELAAGGSEDVDGATSSDPRNPVGVGHRGKGSQLPLDGTPVPNLEDPSNPIGEHSAHLRPAGFGPISPHWQPRVSYAGTYDEPWTTNRAPFLPLDFDPRFLQVAPTDQVVAGEYLQGGEVVEVEGASPTGGLSFQLPGVRLAVTYTLKGAEQERPAHLDTVLVMPDDGVFVVVWRAALRCDKDLLKVSDVTVDVPVPAAREQGR